MEDDEPYIDDCEPPDAGEARSRAREEPGVRIQVMPVAPGTPPCAARLMEAVRATLHRHGIRAANVEIALVDDDHIASLNEQYLGHTGPTDVLAFDLRDEAAAPGSQTENRASPHRTPRGQRGPGAAPPPEPTADGEVIDGQLVISVDTAAQEARARGHSIDAELALYAVHGTLHLLGYRDHATAEAGRMHALEDEILATLGMGAVYARRAE